MHSAWWSFTTLVLQLSFSSLCRAQTSKLFQWQFTTQFSQDLPSCQSLQILVKSFNADNSTHGTPPYYMRAFEVGGVPSTVLIGSDENNLSWTVDHPVDSQLMLGVVDANGSSGGIPPRLYTVRAGQSTQCIPSRSTSSFTVKANISDTVNTCQPWGMTIVGGIRPYTVSLAALNSPVITNVSMGPNDDRFTYINRADPNTMLLAAISDVTGQYASGTPIVKTAGSTDYNCTGLVTTSGNSTVVQQQMDDAARKAASDRKHRNTVIGVCVAIGALAAIVLAGGGFWYYRRKTQHKKELEEAQPHKFEESNGGHDQLVSVVAFPHDASPGLSRSPKSAELSASSVALMHAQYADAAAFDPYNPQVTTDPSPPQSDSTSSSGGVGGSPLTSRPSFAAFPTSSRRYNKGAEAGFRPTSAGSSSSQQRPSSQDGSSLVGSSSYPTTQLVDDHPEIIIQHRDGGPTVRELPPPYADRGQR